MKIVINTCYGGFGLSPAAYALYNKLAETVLTNDHELERDDPILVLVVETLGAAANDTYAKLVVVDIPGDAEWHIDEYDGMEHVAENHRTWY